MNITEILTRYATEDGDQVALVDRFEGRDREVTYLEFESRVGRMASLLLDSGMKTGDTILLFHPMSIELYVAIAAILRCGMIAMFIDPSAGRTYINRCCELQHPRGLIASSKAHLLRITSSSLRRIPLKWSIGPPVPRTRRLERYLDYRETRQGISCSANTPALVSFTSGTTGLPKATVRTHSFLLAQHAAVENSLRLVPGERELVTLPIFVLANLASRVTSIIADADLRQPSRIDPQPVVRQLTDCSVDRLAGAPALLERIAQYCEEKQLQLSGVRKIFTGGGPVSPRMLSRLKTIAPNAKTTVVYGSTEAEPISTIAVDEMDAHDFMEMSSGKGLLVGKTVSALDVRILQDQWGKPLDEISGPEFTRLCCRTGDAGEIVVSGAHVLNSYLKSADVDSIKFQVDGTVWHRTGDAGYFDSHGRLWLLGRCSARVEDRRGALYPLGVEQAAMRHAHVQQAAMVLHKGQRVLVVTLRDPRARPDLTTLLKGLAFANVDAVRVIRRFPVDRRHQSKIDYVSLHQLLES